jgi:MSHA biogenesis protein MshQ
MKRIVLLVLMSISFVVSAATTTNYDYSVRNPGANIFAYQGTSSIQVPSNNSSPSSQLSSSNYGDIASNNNTYHDFINYTKNIYPSTRYVIELDEVANTITELNVFWNGYGVNSKQNQLDGVVIYLWNNNSNTYDLLMSTTSNGIVELEQSITANITDYVDNNNDVTIYVVSQAITFNNESNWIGTDYFSLSVTVDNVAVPASPIVEYRFDECSYNGSSFEVIDQTGNYPAQSFSNLDTFIDAQIERAADFSDANHYIETSIPVSGDFSVATWFKKPTVSSGNRYLVLGAMDNGGGDLLYLDRDNNYRFGVYDGNNSLEGDFWFGDLTSGWHHMVLVYAANSTALYIDGTYKVTIALKPSGTIKYIGTSYDEINTGSPQGFRTALDEFKVYDQSLSSEQINTLFSNELSKNNYDGTSRIAVDCNIYPLAEYRFDETSYNGSTGEVVDSIGGFHGKAISSQPIEGKVCNAVDLSANGTSDYLILDENILTTKTDFTVSLWAQTGNTSSQSALSGAGSGSSNELIMWFSNSSRFLPYLKGNNSGSLAITSLADNNWHHLVWTRSGSQNCLYRDNVFQGCKTLSSSPLNIQSLILGQEQDSIGGGFSSSQDWEGLIDELLIFDSAISPSDIAQIYNNQNAGLGYDGSTRICPVIPPIPFATPVAEYRFDELSYNETANEVVDSIGGFHGVTSDVQPDEGLLCNAADLSATGTADFITLDSAVLDGKNDFTISVWGKTPKSTSQGILSGANSGSFNEFIMWFTSGTQFSPFLKNANNGSLATTSFADDEWHNIVWTRDGTQNCLYIDKALQGCKTLSSSTLSIESLILGQEQDNLGGGFDPSQSWNGLLDELLIFDAVIPESQIEAIYDNHIGGLGYDGSIRSCQGSSLYANFQMDEVSWDGTSEVVDETGNFNAVAVKGATTDGASPALTGNPGTCRYGSFNDNYIALPNSFENLQGSFTITAWINPSNLDAGSRILIDDELNQKGYGFSLGDPGNGKLRFYSRGVNPISVDTTTSITANTWTFVTAVHDSENKTRQIYINGVAQVITGGGTSNTYSGSWGIDTGVATIGGETDLGESNNRFTGNMDEVRVYKGALSESEINTVYAETHPCETIHHFEINHDGQGLTCIAEPLTIKACNDAACTSTIATPADVQIYANGVLKKTVTVTGETNTSFNHLVAETITLSSDQSYTCKNGSSTSCDINFANAGFLLDINSGADVSSCNSVNFAIKAVKLSDSGVSCAPAFTGGQALDFSFSYSNPTSGTKLPVLNGTSMASSGQSQTRTISFDANGEASLPIEYDDAGTLSFTLSEKVSSGVSSSTINKDFFPSKLVVSANLNNTTAVSDPKQIAASNFDLSFIGQCSDNTETPNYQPQSANTVELAARHMAPSSTSSVFGKLTVATSIINTSNSAGTNWQIINSADKALVASYDEVGLVSVNIKDTDYLGNSINALSFVDIGRFYPSYFDVSVTDNSFENACSLDIPSFTYIGQPFGYLNAPLLTITAKNATGVTTQNYTETSFQKLTAVNVNRTFPLSDSVKNGFDNATKMVVVPAISTGDLSKLSNGILDYEFSTSDTFTYSKDSNSEVSEFPVNYDILINSITDSDGVAINAGTSVPLTVQATGGLQRFGRLVLGNSFGSETSPIAQFFEVEYLNTLGKFVRNNDDNCSLITSDATNWSLSNPTNNVTINTVSISGVDSSLDGGKFQGISLSSGDNQGTIDIEYTTQDWLKYNWSGKVSNLHDENTSATATFGVYRGNDRIISWREVGN